MRFPFMHLPGDRLLNKGEAFCFATLGTAEFVAAKSNQAPAAFSRIMCCSFCVHDLIVSLCFLHKWKKARPEVEPSCEHFAGKRQKARFRGPLPTHVHLPIYSVFSSISQQKPRFRIRFWRF